MNKKPQVFDVNGFVSGLESKNVALRVGDDSSAVDLKKLTADLLKNNTRQFSFLINSEMSNATHRIERIYSRTEIRNLVCANLISLYQHDNIIDAVTDYLYGIHVSV